MATDTKDVDVKPASDLEQKIIRQIEYYFGDQNLARDKFLRGKIEENDGWVSLDCLITFNRLKNLSTDFEVINNALAKSTAGLLEINAADNKLRRVGDRSIPDLQDAEFRHAAKLRTVYAKGFPDSYTLDDVDAFFADKGKTLFIKMRRADDKSFKGSVFVEFDCAETAKAFVAMPDLKINDNALTVMLRDDYYKMKNEEKKQAKQSGEGHQGGKGERDDIRPGCVLHFSGAGDDLSREDLKDLLRPHEDIAWVEFSRGETAGYVRFVNDGAAQRAIDAVKAANDDKFELKGAVLVVRALEGEEEVEYRKKAIMDMKNARQKKVVKQQDRRGAKRNAGGKPKRWWQTRNKEAGDDNVKSENGDSATSPDGPSEKKHQRFNESLKGEDDASMKQEGAAGVKQEVATGVKQEVVTGVKRPACDQASAGAVKEE